MLQLDRVNRAYSPEAIAVMTAVFDSVCETQSIWMNDNEATLRPRRARRSPTLQCCPARISGR